MAAKKVQVVNLSIAGADNKVIRKAADLARKNGMILVASVGNWGFQNEPAYPAGYKDVIAVTAVDSRRRIYRRANSGDYVEFAAPGVRLWSPTMKGGKSQSGTSLATPFVSVLVALDLAKGAPADIEEIRKMLRRRSTDIGRVGRDPLFGWGVITAKPSCMN